MQNDDVKYSYIPLITSESQYPFIPAQPQVHQSYTPIQPQVHQYQPAQYPTFDQPQPQFVQPIYPEAQMKYQHLTTRCIVHQYPLDTICRAQDCTNRLLCHLCAAEHSRQFCGHKDTYAPLQDLLDDSIIAELESLAIEEQQCTERANKKCQTPEAPATLLSRIESLRVVVNGVLDWTEELARKRAREWSMLKMKFGWGNLKNEYLVKRRMFLQSRPGGQTWELLQLIDVVNRIKAKQSEMESQIQKKLKSHKNKAAKFIMKLKQKTLKLKEKGINKIEKKWGKIEFLSGNRATVSH